MKQTIFQTVAIALCLLLAFHTLDAQNDTLFFQDTTSGNPDEYKISSDKNIFKVNILSTIHGDLAVSYERILGESFGIEVGVGLLLPYYIPELMELWFNSARVEKLGGGYSILIHPKFYFSWSAPEAVHIGIQYKRRAYAGNGEAARLTDWTLNIGMQSIIKKRFILDYGVGIGFQYAKGMPNTDVFWNYEDGIRGISFPLNLKLGIVL